MIEANREELLAAVTKARMLCERSSIAAFQHALIQGRPENAWVSITTVGGDATITLDVEAEMTEALHVCADAERLAVALAAAGEKAKLSMDGDRLKVACGKSVFRLPAWPKDQFPLMLSTDKAASSFVCEWLGGAIKRVLPFVGTSLSDPRPHARSLALKGADGVIRVMGTDGACAAVLERRIDEAVAPFDVLLPRRVAEIIAKVGVERAIVKDKSILFLGENLQIVSKVLEGKMPDLSNVWPKSESEITADRAALIAAVRTVTPLVSSTKVRSVGFSAKPGMCAVSALGTDGGEGVVEAEVEAEAAEMTMHIQEGYFTSLLESVDGERVRLLYSSERGSALSVEVDGFRAVAMGYRG